LIEGRFRGQWLPHTWDLHGLPLPSCGGRSAPRIDVCPAGPRVSGLESPNERLVAAAAYLAHDVSPLRIASFMGTVYYQA
jgi:hypothetical protein